MKSFDEWTRDIAALADPDDLPEGIWEQDGKYMAECCCCGKYDEIPVGLDEIPEDGYKHHCGGSDRCIP
jgi:hypothetical protein